MRMHDAPGGAGPADGFIELAPALHRTDPSWIREDGAALAASFGPASPWLARGQAHTFCVPGLARASVFRPAGLEIDGAPASFFGHFESSGDAQAEALVLDAARGWARGAGATRIYGPVDLSPALGHCLRLDGGARRYLDEPYNPPRYAKALEAIGLREYRRYAGMACAPAALTRLVAAGAGLARTLGAAGYRFEPLTPTLWDERRDELHALANVMFARNFGFMPLSRTEFDAGFDSGWVHRLDPELSVLVIAPDDRVAGLSPYVPDYVPLLVKGARLDALSYRQHAPALDRLGRPAAVARAGGVAPDHQRAGIAAAMTSWVARRALEKRVSLFYTRLYIGNPVLRLFKDVRAPRRAYALLVGDVT